MGLALINENARNFDWGLFDPHGFMFAAFKYKADAEACKREGMAVAPLVHQTVCHPYGSDDKRRLDPTPMVVSVLYVPGGEE